MNGIIDVQPYAVIDGLDADKVNIVLDAYRDGKKITKTVVRPFK